MQPGEAGPCCSAAAVTSACARSREVVDCLSHPEPPAVSHGHTGKPASLPSAAVGRTSCRWQSGQAEELCLLGLLWGGGAYWPRLP